MDIDLVDGGGDDEHNGIYIVEISDIFATQCGICARNRSITEHRHHLGKHRPLVMNDSESL